MSLWFELFWFFLNMVLLLLLLLLLLLCRDTLAMLALPMPSSLKVSTLSTAFSWNVLIISYAFSIVSCLLGGCQVPLTVILVCPLSSIPIWDFTPLFNAWNYIRWNSWSLLMFRQLEELWFPCFIKKYCGIWISKFKIYKKLIFLREQ